MSKVFRSDYTWKIGPFALTLGVNIIDGHNVHSHKYLITTHAGDFVRQSEGFTFEYAVDGLTRWLAAYACKSPCPHPDCIKARVIGGIDSKPYRRPAPKYFA